MNRLLLFAALALSGGVVSGLAEGNAHEGPLIGCVVSFVDGCMNPGLEGFNEESLASLPVVGEYRVLETLCLARAQEIHQACANEQVRHNTLAHTHTRPHNHTYSPHAHAHTHTCAHTHTHTYTHIYIHTYTHTHTHTRPHTHTLRYAHTSTRSHLTICNTNILQ